jgi:hypothetical protein
MDMKDWNRDQRVGETLAYVSILAWRVFVLVIVNKVIYANL